jgi:hypothetical protein
MIGVIVVYQLYKNRRKMRIPRLKDRLNSKVVIYGKQKLVDLMHELEPDRSKRSLEGEYDRVTRAINGILVAYARDLPRGTHLKVRLNDCVTINLCWMRGKTGRFAPYPNVWLNMGAQLRDRIHRQRAAAYHAWKDSMTGVSEKMQAAAEKMVTQAGVACYRTGRLGNFPTQVDTRTYSQEGTPEELDRMVANALEGE